MFFEMLVACSPQLPTWILNDDDVSPTSAEVKKAFNSPLRQL